MKSNLKLAQQLTPTEILLAKDIWHASELGLKPLVHKKEYTLNFSKIQQDWLKKLAKKFAIFKASNKKFQTIKNHLVAFRDFSDFLALYYPTNPSC